MYIVIYIYIFIYIYVYTRLCANGVTGSFLFNRDKYTDNFDLIQWFFAFGVPYMFLNFPNKATSACSFGLAAT